MAKVTYPSISHAIEGWDAELEDWRIILSNGPLPIFEVAAFGSLPTASNNDRSIAFFNDGVAGWIMAYSDGIAWQKVGHQTATQANSVAATVGALVTDFNALLAKLKAAGLMA